MLITVYALLWFLIAAAAGVFYLAGFFGPTLLTVFGFVISALFFTGLVTVLPWWVDRRFSPKY